MAQTNIEKCLFDLESVAHLQGLEQLLLPQIAAARIEIAAYKAVVEHFKEETKSVPEK
jgi:hypothetical protein